MKVKLLRPLDGQPIGTVAEYPDDDAKRLQEAGVVAFHSEKAAPAPLNKKAPEPLNKAGDVQRTKKGR
jgi:hypothetical protein